MRKFTQAPDPLGYAGLGRRLAAMLYDTLLVISVLWVAGAIYLAIFNAIIGEEALRALSESGGVSADPLFRSVMFITMFLFFGYFWTRKGQTLGMQVWRLRVQNSDGTSISWMQSLMRFGMAWVSFLAFGLGYLWMLWDKDKRSWQDRFSDTQIILLPKKTPPKSG